MIEIVPYNEDITCIKTATERDGKAIMFVYAYLVRDTLFDAGCGNSIDEIREFARKNEINHVYVSHSHEDHVGSLHAFDDGVTQIHANEMTRKELLEPQKIGEFFDYVWGNLNLYQKSRLCQIGSQSETFPSRWYPYQATQQIW